MKRDDSKKKLIALHLTDPQLAQLHQNEQTQNLLKEISGKLDRPTEKKAASIKIKGNVIKGQDGHTPVLGVDYFTEKDKQQMIEDSTPVLGVDYFTADDLSYITKVVKPRFGVDYFTEGEIRKIKRELKPIPGVDFEIPKPSRSPVFGIDYFTEQYKQKLIKDIIKNIPQQKNISPTIINNNSVADESADSIIKKINSKPKSIDFSVIKNIPYDMLHGISPKRDGAISRGGATLLSQLTDAVITSPTNGQYLVYDSTLAKWKNGAGSGGGLTELTATGTVDGANTAFTFVSEPTYIVSDGVWYKKNKGWTWSVSTATMTIPPNDAIWGF